MTVIKAISCRSRGITFTKPNVRNAGTSLSLHQSPHYKDSRLCAFPLCKLRKNNRFPRLVHNAMKNTRCASILTFAKMEDFISENEGSQKKVTDGFRRDLTVQDVLREHMKGKQLDGRGGGNGNTFGDGSDGFGGPDGEEFQEQLDEVLQVIMATIGVIFLYIIITNGEEQLRLARDTLRYLCGARASYRLICTMEKWRTIYETITWKRSFFK